MESGTVDFQGFLRFLSRGEPSQNSVRQTKKNQPDEQLKNTV